LKYHFWGGKTPLINLKRYFNAKKPKKISTDAMSQIRNVSDVFAGGHQGSNKRASERTLSKALKKAGVPEEEPRRVSSLVKKKTEPTTPVLRVDPSSVLIDDMPSRMRDDAVIFTLEALERYRVEQNIATYIKFRMDTAYGPQFHVVVGRSYGCKVTHEFHMCLLLQFHGMKILVFKAG
jgi:dynein light chain LC8-type